MSGCRIYVACLAAYNNGVLHGRWIDANQSAPAIWEEITAMLAASPIPLAEEWALHDYEGFGNVHLSEYEPIERVSNIATGIAAFGDAFAAWLAYDPSADPADTAAFEESFRGEWDSLPAYADDLADSLGLHDAAEVANSPYVRVDLDLLARDLDIEMYVVDTDHGTVYVFDPNV